VNIATVTGKAGASGACVVFETTALLRTAPRRFAGLMPMTLIPRMRIPDSPCDNRLIEIYICDVGGFFGAGRDVHDRHRDDRRRGPARGSRQWRAAVASLG